MSILYDSKIPHRPKTLEVVINSSRGIDNGLVEISVALENNPLVTEENVEVWANYLKEKLPGLINRKAMASDAFRKMEEKVKSRYKEEQHWKEREKVAKHRNELRKIPKFGYIPAGLTVDYNEWYDYYITSAIEWTPNDADDFLYQVRTLEKIMTKNIDKCLGAHRPDAAYAQALLLCQKLPSWKVRKELDTYFNQYTARLRKLVKTSYKAMVDSAVAWNNQAALSEATEIINAHSSLYADWELRPATLQSLIPDTSLTGEPIHLDRAPSKAEQTEIRIQQMRKEMEAKRKAAQEAEHEAEKHSLIPLRDEIEQLFVPDHIDWECTRIGHDIYDWVGKEMKLRFAIGDPHAAILLFLQTVKSMCRHFISDEHWCYFDDIYDPNDSCDLLFKIIKSAHAAGLIPQSDVDFLHEAWKEIEAMEAHWNYGIANYDMKFKDWK